MPWVHLNIPYQVLSENNVFVFVWWVVKTGKQRGTTGNAELDKMASTGLTEKQLQLSVEVC